MYSIKEGWAEKHKIQVLSPRSQNFGNQIKSGALTFTVYGKNLKFTK